MGRIKLSLYMSGVARESMACGFRRIPAPKKAGVGLRLNYSLRTTDMPTSYGRRPNLVESTPCSDGFSSL